MKKNNILIFIFLLYSFFSFSQEKSEKSIKDLKSIFHSSDEYSDSFSGQDLKYFEIKSFNAFGEQIPLCINEKLEIFLDCESKIKYAQIINSIIYDLDMNKIGHCFLGKKTKKDLDSFWETLKHWKGNITIYDKTESYRLATFMYFEKKKDYFSIMGLDTTDMNFDKVKDYKKLLNKYNIRISKYPDDNKTIAKQKEIEQAYMAISKANLKMLNKAYKKLLKEYNVFKYPDDEEIATKYKEIQEAYMAISKKIDPDYQEENNWLEKFFSKNRRSNWSQDEGYVPYTKRKRKDSNPISQENKERYPYFYYVD